MAQDAVGGFVLSTTGGAVGANVQKIKKFNKSVCKHAFIVNCKKKKGKNYG